jgi:hypothetical protein
MQSEAGGNMEIELTEEQKKARRAEISRQNGRKSKGPVTPEGKHRSSMNAISTGQHVELHKEDLPPFFHLLGIDDRADYIRSFQAHMRKFKPDSEMELDLVRRMTAEIFQYDRNTRMATMCAQMDFDNVIREFPDLDVVNWCIQGTKRVANQRDLYRMIERNKRAHLAAYGTFIKLLAQTRKLFPMQPPEPVDITADMTQLAPKLPEPEAVDQMLALADRAKKEPDFKLPKYVLNFLQDKEVIDQVAPDYDASELFARYGIEEPLIAA